MEGEGAGHLPWMRDKARGSCALDGGGQEAASRSAYWVTGLIWVQMGRAMVGGGK